MARPGCKWRAPAAKWRARAVQSESIINVHGGLLRIECWIAALVDGRKKKLDKVWNVPQHM
jgi:hypothetical protein